MLYVLNTFAFYNTTYAPKNPFLILKFLIIRKKEDDTSNTSSTTEILSIILKTTYHF